MKRATLPPAHSLALETQAAAWVVMFPDAAPRIRRGLLLAKQPGALVPEAGGYRVKGSLGVSYRVTRGVCDCPDAMGRGVRCKHRWAASLRFSLVALGLAA